MRYRVARLAALYALAIGGCAIKEEGAVDYRRVPLGQDNSNISGENLIEKYISLDEAHLDAFIAKDDYYQITLKQGVIRDYWEKLGTHEGAEIAIVATVFEIGDRGRDKELLKFDFSPNAVQEARVIYYSDDVWSGQALNISQLPIYGPVR